MRCARVVLAVGLVLLLPSLVNAGERELNESWRGAWVVTAVPTRSNCARRYTKNEVHGDVVSSAGEHGFASGELARIEKVNLKRRLIEVFLDIEVPLLRQLTDGPFVLYEEVTCKVNLRIQRPERGDGALNEAIGQVVEHHRSRDSAEASKRWNQRRRDPFPDDYEETLAQYEVWKAQRVNSAVQARLDESIDEAARLTDRIDDDPEYLAGFGAGIDHARDQYLSSDCGILLDKSVNGFVGRAPKDRSSDWAKGYRDAQRLLFYIEMAHRLRSCFLR